MKYRFFFLLFLSLQFVVSQEPTLDYFLETAKQNAPALSENVNLQNIGNLQNDLIIAQNKALQVNITSEILIAPYFDNRGRFIDITTTPSPQAYGYDIGITNGGLYSAQLNITKNLFNQAAVDNLLLQNKIQNNSLVLIHNEIEHNLIKNITDTYIIAYQLQLQSNFTSEIIKDIENRLQVVELLVKRAVLMESDYLLLQLDVESKKLELEQIKNSLRTAINQLYSLSGIPMPGTTTITIPNLVIGNAPNTNFYIRKFENDSIQIEADRSVFENKYKPQLSLYGNTGLNAVEIRNIDKRIGLSAGLRLTVPIYDGNQRSIIAQQSKFKQENIEFYRKNNSILLANGLNSIESQRRTLQDNLLLIEEQLRQQQKVLEIYKGKLVQGQVSIVDYLNVVLTYKQNVYTKLQMQTNIWLLQSQYNYLNW
ncbi:MAG: TolC family protein [Maribacter sp.]|nr:TolC family protein [Maribacter sp.]